MRPGGDGLPYQGPTQRRGPDFFEDGVMDDPEFSILYDPQRDGYPELLKPIFVGEPRRIMGLASQTTELAPQNDILPAQYVIYQGEPGLQQPDKQPDKGGPVLGGGQTELKAPRLPYTIEALPELGAILIRAMNPEDLQALLDLIARIQELAKQTEIQIEVVPLQQADATSVVNYLQQLYGRVVIGPFTTNLVPPGNQPQRPAAQQTPGTGLAQLGQPIGTATSQGAANAYIYLLPLPRFNNILVAASKSRMDDIKKHIQLFDREWSGESKVTKFQLKHQPASRAAGTLQAFWNARIPNETLDVLLDVVHT